MFGQCVTQRYSFLSLGLSEACCDEPGGDFSFIKRKCEGFTSLAFVPANWGAFSSATASLDQSSQPELLAQKPDYGALTII
jgi:hypothetical protein